ncbi:helix-turn-helix transcriptional regulator [Nocardia sp. NPDC006630]|uniref:helix-turn-helix domain-containing protein n=1 Tax=Nocardia sp. NPDC006630 TaxID=3157181 RepID=UPI0033A80C98
MVGSTIPRRAFGRFLRSIREQAGATLLTAGLEIDTSKQTILRLEDGLPTKVSTPQLKSLLDMYSVTPAVRAEVLLLWEELKQQAKVAKLQGVSTGWWQAYSRQYAPYFNHYLRLEAVADHLTSHQLVFIPGILQTPAYRRSLIETALPNLPEIDVSSRLELAARRQERLADNTFRVDALLSEAVLRHRIGGPAVTREQLQRLQEAGAQDNISIRVVPFNAGTHSGYSVDSFSMLEFPPLASRLVEPPVVYVEGSEGALYLEHAEVIARFRQAVVSMKRVALSENDTRDLVSSIAKEYAP